MVAELIGAGADPNITADAAGAGERPLHWAAGSDDVEVAGGLIDLGADMEAPGGSLTSGTALDNAVGYGQWQVARLLVDRGAHVQPLWVAAALGLSGRVEELMASTAEPPHAAEINNAFWHACSGGQPRTAAYLFHCGANVNHARETPLDIACSVDDRRTVLTQWLRARDARQTADDM